MENHAEFISRFALFKSFELTEIELCLQEGSFQTASYGKSNTIHYAGDICEKPEIILSGKVVVERIDESGNLMSIAEFFSGDILGGNLLFSKNPTYPMTVTAKSPAKILEINKKRLLRLLKDNPEFLECYLEYVSDHTVILGDRIKHYVKRSIRESIISYLDCERKRQNGNNIKLTMSKTALAERIGVQRASLSRVFAELRDEGLIRYSARYIEILKPDCLTSADSEPHKS